MKRDWVEGAAQGTGANWPTYDSTNFWQVAGAGGPDDFVDLGLGSADFDTFTVDIELNEAGINCINNWIENPGENHGFLIAEASNVWPYFRTTIKTSENSALSDRPKFSLGYYFPDGKAPTNASVIIDNGELDTTNFVVELTLFAENPTPIDMQISELSNFYNATWINYQTNYTWTFEGPFGEKTVYARFADGGAGISKTASDTIDIVPEPGGIVFSMIALCALLR